ncbi:MAG: hypothetical protein EA351_00990 [Gemmatimonadales bacterium]|nr:MAG: hypothetical protein EA351_00990 [Gemmatimonadales bacterium]
MTRILAAVETGSGARNRSSWWADLAEWWQPAAALAAAAVGLLFLVPTASSSGSGGSPGQATALELLAAEGDPAALWTAFGVPADPVLATLVLDDSPAQDRPDRTSPPPEEDR